MRIALSLLNFRPGLIGGTEQYLRELVARIPAATDRQDELVLLGFDAPLSAVAEHIPPWRAARLGRSDRRLVIERLLEAMTPYRCRSAERLVAGSAADVTFFPQQSVFPLRTPPPAVLTVHDVQHLFFPQYFGAIDLAYRRRAYAAAVRRAERIIAISDFTRRCLLERMNVPAEKVVVVPHGFTPRHTGDVTPAPGPGRPYLYYPSATFPHKGHAALLEALATLRRTGRCDWDLVLTGLRTGHWDKLARQIDALGLRSAVHHYGFVPFGDVLALYAGAEAIVVPSEFEGFGLPVLEGVSFGKNVITSRLAIFDELGVPGDKQIDFADPDQLAAALDAGGPTVLTRAPWTWDRCARATVEVLRSAADA